MVSIGQAGVVDLEYDRTLDGTAYFQDLNCCRKNLYQSLGNARQLSEIRLLHGITDDRLRLNDIE